MPEYYLNLDPVGFNRAFLTGRVPGDDEFEIELTPHQIRMVEAFQSQQQQAFQEFLVGLVL